MNPRTQMLVCAMLAALSGSAVFADDLPKPLSRMELKDGDAIVFLGDSITHQCLYTQYLENFFYTRYPTKRFRFHNAGVGGAKAWDALQRFDKDVAAYKPKYVTVLLGMNDGRYQPFDKQTFETYRKDMQAVIAAIKKTGATPILMTPTMFDSRAHRVRKNSRRKRNEDMLRQLQRRSRLLRRVAAGVGRRQWVRLRRHVFAIEHVHAQRAEARSEIHRHRRLSSPRPRTGRW